MNRLTALTFGIMGGIVMHLYREHNKLEDLVYRILETLMEEADREYQQSVDQMFEVITERLDPEEPD